MIDQREIKATEKSMGIQIVEVQFSIELTEEQMIIVLAKDRKKGLLLLTLSELIESGSNATDVDYYYLSGNKIFYKLERQHIRYSEHQKIADIITAYIEG